MGKYCKKEVLPHQLSVKGTSIYGYHWILQLGMRMEVKLELERHLYGKVWALDAYDPEVELK